MVIILRIRQMLLWRGSVCLTQPGEPNWGLEELPDCSLKAAAATEEAGLRYMGVYNTQSALDAHRMYFTTYAKSSIVPVTFTPTLSLVIKIVCRSLEYVFDSSRIFSV